MLDYSFGQSLDRYDWSTGKFMDTPAPIGQYTNGIPAFSISPLSLHAGNQNKEQETTAPPTPDPPVPTPAKKSKAWIWFILIPLIIGLSFLGYKKFAS